MPIDLSIGRVFGDYQVIGVLGSGGMSRVYKVRNLISDRIEAMKVLLADLANTPELEERFLREIKVLASFDHPNIASLRTALRADNQLLMIMELVEGETLEQKLRTGPLQVKQAVDYVSQALSALDYAHQRGVVHRDVKPANMMLTPNGSVKLLDFGIAKDAAKHNLTMTGTTLGSLYYMSPEQIRGATTIDARADLYSLGVSLYELVTGKRPFDADSQYGIMVAHLQTTPVPPVELNQALTKPLSDVILFSLQKDPEQRFQDASAFATALDRVEAGSPATDAPILPTKRFPTRPQQTDSVKGTQPRGVSEFTRMIIPGKRDSVHPGNDDPPDAALIIAVCEDFGWIGKKYPLTTFPFLIGRPVGNLTLPFDSAISREHAEVNFVNGMFTMTDLGSANGTYVNGKRLRSKHPEPLPFGARILLGSNTQLSFVSTELTELQDLVGMLIGGRYTLDERLFVSAKSGVYCASDSKLPHRVMVKILSPRLVRYPGYREQFEREARIACQLLHPNIGSVLDYGDTDLPGGTRSVYICMEYLDGGPLSQYLSAEKPLEFARTGRWLEKLASALSYVHKRGIVHGGIKPSAIVFDSNDNPYLTDFAIAVSTPDNLRPMIVGSPAFLAPEQWDGEDISPAIDQYSLAALFYLILTGSPPHEGQDNPVVRRRNLLRGPAPAHQAAQQSGRPVLPAAVSSILERAMAPKPADRFPDILAFCQPLAELLIHGKSTAQRRPSVFISYRRETGSGWALLFRNELDREYGYEVFVDAEQRDAAGQFPPKLKRNIERSDVFVCLLGENTLASVWVTREIEVAYRARKPMVPVFQEGFSFPIEMEGLPEHVRELLLFDGVKLLDRQNVYVSAAIKALGDVIRQSLTGFGASSTGAAE